MYRYKLLADICISAKSIHPVTHYQDVCIFSATLHHKHHQNTFGMCTETTCLRCFCMHLHLHLHACVECFYTKTAMSWPHHWCHSPGGQGVISPAAGTRSSSASGGWWDHRAERSGSAWHRLDDWAPASGVWVIEGYDSQVRLVSNPRQLQRDRCHDLQVRSVLYAQLSNNGARMRAHLRPAKVTPWHWVTPLRVTLQLLYDIPALQLMFAPDLSTPGTQTSRTLINTTLLLNPMRISIVGGCGRAIQQISAFSDATQQICQH